MSEILIIYSTTDGHTKTICEYVRQRLTEYNHLVSVVSIEESDNINKTRFDKLVIGASIRYGKHSKNVYQFISNNLQILENRPSAFFSVNLVARKQDKNTPETNPYFKKFITQTDWKPSRTAVFAGKLNYPIYNFIDRQIIRLIMWLTKGPTDPQTVVEYTNWKQVDHFARMLHDM